MSLCCVLVGFQLAITLLKLKGAFLQHQGYPLFQCSPYIIYSTDTSQLSFVTEDTLLVSWWYLMQRMWGLCIHFRSIHKLTFLSFNVTNCFQTLIFIRKSLSFTLFYMQLRVGNGEDFFPRNGRWNFNNKVCIMNITYYLKILIISIFL